MSGYLFLRAQNTKLRRQVRAMRPTLERERRLAALQNRTKDERTLRELLERIDAALKEPVP